jgi:serine/threonine protein kinase
MTNRIQGLNDSYLLQHQQIGKKGKFGGITIGVRESDKMPISVKKAHTNNSPQNLDKLYKLTHFKHPSLGETIDIINQQKDTYIIRKFYEGTDLKTILKKRSFYKKLNQEFWINAFIYLLDGIESMHQSGLIHRDIKPSNIIIRHQPEVKSRHWKPEDILLIDFEQSNIYPSSVPTRSPFSLLYSPPEQLLNRNDLLDPTCDLFSLAITLYEVLAHKPPYEDCNAEILLNLQLTYPMKRPSKIDEDLFQILSKAAFKERFPLPPRRLAYDVIQEILKKGIESRYQSASEFKADLIQYLTDYKVPEKTGFFKRLFSK